MLKLDDNGANRKQVNVSKKKIFLKKQTGFNF